MYNSYQIGEGSTARIYLDPNNQDYVYKVSKSNKDYICNNEFELQRDAHDEVLAASSDYIAVPQVIDVSTNNDGLCQIKMERVVPLCSSSNNAYAQVHVVLNDESRDESREDSGDYLGRLEVLDCINNICGSRPSQHTLDFLAEKSAQLIATVQFGSRQTATDTELVLGFTGGDNCYKLYLLDFDKSNRWTEENKYVVRKLAETIASEGYYPVDDIERYDIFWDMYINIAKSYGYENMARKVQEEVLKL